jgi:hypothetical protein
MFTAASTLMATWEDEGKVAESLGDLPSVPHAHYRELATRAEARRSCGMANEGE